MRVASRAGATGLRALITERVAPGVVYTTFHHPLTLANIVTKLPDAQTLDRIAYRTSIFAFPVFGFGVIFGAIWAEEAWGRYWGWDPKETVAFITWVIYAAYLHARSTAGWRDKKAAWINVIGFVAMVFNLFFINLVTVGLHSYAGVN